MNKKNNIFVFIAGDSSPTTMFYDNTTQLCGSILSELIDAEWYEGEDASGKLEELLELIDDKDSFTETLMEQYTSFWELNRNWVEWGYVDQQPNEFKRCLTDITSMSAVKKELNQLQRLAEQEESNE